MLDHEIQKLYYSIGEVADLVGLEPHVLRYWETEFEQLEPRKNRAGRRIYTDEDIEVVRRIQTLLKVDKYTIEGARQVMEQGAPSTENREQLRALRAFLENVLKSI